MANNFSLEMDGTTVKISPDKYDDVEICLDDYEPIHLSPLNALILAAALQSCVAGIQEDL